MALPPILSSMPILKIFRSDTADTAKQKQNDDGGVKKSASTQTSENSAAGADTVSISDQALAAIRSGAIETSIHSEDQARDAAATVRREVSDRPDVSLGAA